MGLFSVVSVALYLSISGEPIARGLGGATERSRGRRRRSQNCPKHVRLALGFEKLDDG